MSQFSIKYLFLGVFIAALLLGFVAREPIGVGLAASFCVASWLGILVLSYLTIRNLVDLLMTSIRQKRIGGLTARYRWAYLDGFIALWLFFTIAISNFVLENSIANARYLVWSGWIVWLAVFLVMVGQIIWQRRNREFEPD